MMYELPVVDDNFVIMRYWNNFLDHCDRNLLDSTQMLREDYNGRHGDGSWVLEFKTEEDRFMFKLRWS